MPPSPTDLRIRDYAESDLEAALRLNNAAVPHVNALGADALARLAAESSSFRLAVSDERLCGLLLALPPTADYASINYRWFTARYEDFVYIDRVIVAPHSQRIGLAGRLYTDLVDRAGRLAPMLACEVNLRPRNEPSLVFHDRLGFRPVGEQDTEAGSKRVVMLRKALHRQDDLEA